MSAASLKVNTANLAHSRIAVNIEVPAQRCQVRYEEALSKLSRSIKLPGFRQGKVPKAVILQQLGQVRIKAAALETLIEEVWKEALDKESIEPLCEPELKEGFDALLENFLPTKPLTITLETDIAPNPLLNKTKGLKAEVEMQTFDPTRIDELIEQSQKQLATVIPIEGRPAAMGDIAVLDFKGTYSDDGSEIEGGNGESMDIDLEIGRMIPGFVEGIVGMNINDSKTLSCEFPSDYPQEDARGRKAKFEIKLQDLKKRELPKLDDEFAQKTSDKKSMKELREELETRLKEDLDRQNVNNRQEALLQSLVKELEVDLPKSLIDIEVRNIVEQTARKFSQQGMDVKSMFTQDLVKSLMESSRPEAEEILRKKLALNALAKAEGIEATKSEIEDKIKEVTIELAGEKNIDTEKLREVVTEDLLQDKLLEWLNDNNNVIEKNTKKKEVSEKKPKINPSKKKQTSTKKADKPKT